jgi:hypothetical protein
MEDWKIELDNCINLHFKDYPYKGKEEIPELTEFALDNIGHEEIISDEEKFKEAMEMLTTYFESPNNKIIE